MAQKFANAARATLSGVISDVDTSIAISADGSLFPVANTGSSAIGPSADWFKAVLQDVDGIEIVFVRTHADGSLNFTNVLRGQEGTTARSFPSGATFGCRPTAGDSADFSARQPALQVNDVPPANPVSGQEWFDGTSGIKYTYVVDDTSGQWVDAATVALITAQPGESGGTFGGSILVMESVIAEDVTIAGDQNAFCMSSTIPSGRTVTIEDGGVLLCNDRDTGEANSAANVGAGTGTIYKGKSGADLQLKSIKAGANITIANNADDVTITAAAPGEVNTASSLGGTSMYSNKFGSDLQFKGLAAGSGVTLTPGATTVTISTVIISPTDPGSVNDGTIWVTP